MHLTTMRTCHVKIHFRSEWASLKAEVRRSFITTTIREQRPRSHHKGAIGRVRTGDQRPLIRLVCQPGYLLPWHSLGRIRLQSLMPHSSKSRSCASYEADLLHKTLCTHDPLSSAMIAENDMHKDLCEKAVIPEFVRLL